MRVFDIMAFGSTSVRAHIRVCQSLAALLLAAAGGTMALQGDAPASEATMVEAALRELVPGNVSAVRSTDTEAWEVSLTIP